MNHIVWIGEDGYDNGGSATLGIEFKQNLKIKTLFRGEESKNKSNVLMYNNKDELSQLLSEIKPEIILFHMAFTPKYKEHSDVFEVIFNYQKEYKTKIILIDCSRRGHLFNKSENLLLEEFSQFFKWKFDAIWGITGLSENKWKKFAKDYKTIDVNAHLVKEGEIIENREKTIGYISRFQNFKGINRLIDSFEKTKLEEQKYSYIYIGNDHDLSVLNRNGKISGPIYIVSHFAKSLKDKMPKDCFSMKSSLDDSITSDKINIYPRYNFNEKEDVFRKVGVAICPTLARMRKKEDKESFSLFPNLIKIKDEDDKYIEKNKKYWINAMEYVNYEFIDYGIPVMFSRDYCLTYDPEMINIFPELIYDNLEDCLIYCQDNYEKLLKSAPKQKEWLRNKLHSINNIVKKELEDILNK